MVTAIQKSETAIVFGEYQEVEVLAKRIKTMMRGGEKLRNEEAMALAQVAKVTNLNPFIGEVWYIPGSGPMVGIAGARRIDQEDTANRGGYSTVEFFPVDPQEAGATEVEVKDVVAAFRAEITDSNAVLNYQRMFTETLKSLRDSGIADPVPVARDICGPRPKWIGYGFSKRNESTRMSKTQVARKRSEADALKKKIVIPFGAQVAETDMAPDYVDARTEDVGERRSKEQSLRELGFSDAEKHSEIGLGDLDKDYPPAVDPEAVYRESADRVMKIQVNNETKEIPIGNM